MKKIVSSLILGMLILSGCNSATTESTKQSSETGDYPLTISNFAKAEGSDTWIKKDQTFEKAPEKVLANTQPAAELLLHLGLKDKIAGVGAVFGEPDTTVAKDFGELNQLSSEYIGKETALSVDPDLVYGRGGLFDNQDWGVGTVDSLNEMGINTFVLSSSVTGATFDSVYNDIDNLGKIFDVKDKAEAFKSELKTRQKALEEKVTSEDNQTFALIFTSDPSALSVYSASKESFFNNIFEMIKLDNVFKDESGDVSIEKLIETDPEVIIVPEWETESGKTNVEEILQNEKLSSMQAVKNKKVYQVDYNYMFGYGYQSLDGLEKLVDEMYPE